MSDSAPAPPISAEEHRAYVFRRIREAGERYDQGLLPEREVFWSDHYSWLKDSGYLLRKRYAPGRTLSFKDGEDVKSAFTFVADATRISDNSLVLIKKCEPLQGDFPVFHEDQIIRKFSSEPLASNPKNRCVRMIEILPVPDDPKVVLIVMPFYYDWDIVPFLTIGDAMEFISQIFEGLQFMHNNHVWHGDMKSNNILMDVTPLLIEDINPWQAKRTRDLSRHARFKNRLEHPVKYHIIDFDLSGVHDPSTGPALLPGGYGGTTGVPEFKFEDRPCDPFAVDVYCLGNIIRMHFTEGEEAYYTKKQRGFKFMEGLVADMMNEDPKKRPKIDEALRRFSEIKAGLSWWKLRSRYAPADEHRLSRIFKFAPHWSRQLLFIARGIPAIPTP